jgi:Cys-tRNA(Pro)/Cys-tRNA(Cys) deacylase
VSATLAVQACERAGVAFELLSYTIDDPDEPYGLAAARALGLSADAVFKTLIAEVDGKPAVALVGVARQCNLKALAAAIGGKRAEMAPPLVAERVTGYVVGGISPLGQKRRLPTVIDASAATLERMWVSGGRRGLELGLAPHDLIAITAATVAPIAQ